tara:strand:- start:423 stop:962 length:540 start_codon:yes stop_codon:yes gene_type:complete
MSNDPTSDDPTKGMSWAEKKRDAAKQARAKKQRAIEEACVAGDHEEYDRLVKEMYKAKEERAAAKKAARDLKATIKEKLPSGGGRKWADNEIARAVRSGRNAEGIKPRNPVTQWNMQPGQMVRLVNKAEAWTDAYMQKIIPKGAIGILLDPPTGNRAAVMFGADVYTIECKKLRPIGDE